MTTAFQAVASALQVRVLSLAQIKMKNKHIGSTLDSLLEELGELEEIKKLRDKKIKENELLETRRSDKKGR